MYVGGNNDLIQQENGRKKRAVLLAAGEGKRMKSDRPKVLAEVLFRPMACWVEDACRAAGVEDVVIVTGEDAGLVEAAMTPGCRFVRQEQRRGTGHAVMMAKEYLTSDTDILVLNADAPLITPETIEAAHEVHVSRKNAVTLVTAKVPNPFGYGRVELDQTGGVRAIVEHKDATPEQQAIDEINSGAYWFDGAFLSEALGKLTDNNAQGEYYLTDTVRLAVEAKLAVGRYICGDWEEVLGANSRKELAALNRKARARVLERHMDHGVDIPFDEGVIIGPLVEIGHDTRILPGTVLLGRTKIAPHCEIGPDSHITDSVVGQGSKITATWLTEAAVGSETTIGPFAQLRPATRVGNGVKIGDFVELKNTSVGDETSIAHLTYIGDSDIGKLCNFGCGVVTANYDGKQKYRTMVGDRAFIGCNTNLISPVTVGEGAYTAAGTTVDQDVPAGALAVGRARQENKLGWADRNIGFKKEK